MKKIILLLGVVFLISLVGASYFTENSQTFNSSAYETAYEAFGINISYNNSIFSSIAANLWYNGQSYTATKILDSDGNTTFSTSLDIPLTSDITNILERREEYQTTNNSIATSGGVDGLGQVFNFGSISNLTSLSLSKIQILVASVTGSPVKVCNVAADGFTPTTPCTNAVITSTVSTTAVYKNITFTTPINLTAGVNYTISFKGNPATEVWNYNSSSSSYPSGSRLKYVDPPAEWQIQSGDMWFEVYGNATFGNVTYEILLTNSTGTFKENATTQQQEVYETDFGLCDASRVVPYFNFTILEEGTNNDLNATLSAVWSYWLGTGSVYKTLLYSNDSDTVHNYGFCFSPSDKTIYLDGLSSYASSGYDSRSYYFSNTSKNNASGNIDLYLLSTASSDIVVFTVVDSFLTPVNNAEIRILRWNLVTDTFYLVNTIYTGSGGQASANLRLNDAYYVFVVSVDGVTYLTTEPETLFSTTKTLQIDTTTSSTIYDTFQAVDYSLTFDNSTNIVDFIYNDESNTIGGGCLEMTKLTAVGSVIISSTCETTPTGEITYEIISNGTYTARGYVFASQPSGVLTYNLATLNINLGDDTRFATIAASAQVISMIFIGTLAMFGVAIGSILWGLILIVISTAVLNLLGFINFSLGFITLVISIIIMIALSLQRKVG